MSGPVGFCKLRTSLWPLLAVAALAAGLRAEPLSRRIEVDFHREVLSRHLKGLATRSDGRLVGGPTLTEISTPAPADLLWCLEPTADPQRFLLGTGPDGRVFEVTVNPSDATFAARERVRLEDPQVFALRSLPDGGVLAGTSPKGGLYLIRGDTVAARAVLPADSIFDILLLDDRTALVATGNPGRIYRVDLARFAAAADAPDPGGPDALAARGITLFGEIRDRNVRRLAALADGRIVAGSAPRGNLYAFPSAGGAPLLLQENREAEVTDLLPQPNGDLFASIVFSGTSGESRLGSGGGAGGGSRPGPAPKESRDTPEATLPPVQVERFSGRSSVVWFPAQGFPETLTSRANAAFYRLARHGDTLIIAGGDTGELLGFDLQARFSLTFAGSSSAQLNHLAPLAGRPGRFLVLRNNAPGLAVLDFSPTGRREAETRRLDLSTPSTLGAFRFSRIRELDPATLAIDVKVSQGADELEGWSDWTPLHLDADGGWRASGLRGRNARLRIRLPETAAGQRTAVELDRGALFVLPQNRRPTLQEFRVLSPNYGLILVVDSPPSPVVTLGQLLQGPSSREEDKRKGSLTGSQVVPQPGAQVVFWTVVDPDGDAFTSSFSYRREGEGHWTEVVSESRDSHAQFDTSHLADGIYFTRLIVREIAPRPPGDRLTHTFETDDLVIDHTAPVLVESAATRTADGVVIKVRGRDALSLLDNLEVTFSNGVREVLEQPLDGIRDGRDETFVLDVPLSRVTNATSVELTLYDAAGNKVSKRLGFR